MKLGHAFKGQRVCYVPNHANGDLAHPDCECGTVSSVNHKYVFVKFDKQVRKLGFDGTTSQSCDPSDIHEINERFEPKP